MKLLQLFKAGKVILVMVGFGGGTSAQAIPLYTERPEDTVAILFGDQGTYNATTDLFHMTIRNARGFTSVNPRDRPAQFTGVLELDAYIDDTGYLSSGTVSWYGGSSDLGIPDNTALIVGEIEAFAFLGSMFQFRIEGSYAPELGINPQNDLGLTLSHLPSTQGRPPNYYEGNDIFKGDFTTIAYSHETLITIAEPSSIALLGLGVLALIWTASPPRLKRFSSQVSQPPPKVL